jgi:hypothetical protein
MGQVSGSTSGDVVLFLTHFCMAVKRIFVSDDSQAPHLSVRRVLVMLHEQVQAKGAGGVGIFAFCLIEGGTDLPAVTPIQFFFGN